MTEVSPHIGTLREKPLHAALKEWYARPGDQAEKAIDGFVIDLVRDDLLIEIQTRGFSLMKKKLGALLDGGRRVRIVHPIPIDRWIVKVDQDGAILSRRRSPKHGEPTDVFSELVSFPEHLTDSGFEVDVILTIEEEYRHHTPGRSWRRGGWSVLERRLVEVVDSLLLKTMHDLADLMPDGLPDTFTTTDLAERLGRPLRTAQQMAYCLRQTGVVVVTGKRGNSVEYCLSRLSRPGGPE